MKKSLLQFGGAVLLLFILGVGSWLWKNFKGAGPAFRSPGGDIISRVPSSDDPNLPEAINQTDFALKLPKGFTISIYAKDLEAPRVLAVDPVGNILASIPKQNRVVAVVDENRDGFAEKIVNVAKNLNKPHGLAFRCFTNKDCQLYIAETDKISAGDYDIKTFTIKNLKTIINLPTGGRHWTKTILFTTIEGKEKLLISSGSSCDVCVEKDWRRASIMSVNSDGTDLKLFASGLRNSVFMATNPIDGKLWATEMGRDFLGDDLPPDEINIIDTGPSLRSGQNPPDFGWPICYGKNIHDAIFDKNQYIRNPCEDKISSHIDLPAHSAPLGLAFIPEEGPAPPDERASRGGWPEDYWYDLIVAFHGSWNRTEPTGYKLSRIKLDAKGNFEGMDSTGSPQVEDFISGWLSPDGKTSLGRPVDIIIQSGGIMYVSDDKAGVVYKIEYLGGAGSKQDNIIVDSPKENSKISSPFTITGRARGTWYFEASFPVEVRDANNNLLGQSHAQAQGEWMTTDFVPFSSNISFQNPETGTGWLIFKKDNPSGLPENDAEYKLKIKF